MSQLQSCHHAVNFFTWWGFSIYQTAHRMWLRSLSSDHEEELKVVALLSDYVIIIGVL